MENLYSHHPENSENENFTSAIAALNNSQSKKEHFRSRMKTQLTIPNGVSLKQKLRTQQTLDFSLSQPTISDEYYFHYEELDKIGEGCHSVVKKCMNKLTNKIYAVKIIRTDDIEIINGAKSEFNIIKDLNHDSILKVHDIFINQKTGYVRLITEFSDSMTLKKFIEKSPNKCLTEQLSSKISQQLLSALSYLHEKNIVHRDIKPSNILIHPESLKVTLIDFGISRYFNTTTEMCTPTGTPLYKAPEMIRGDPYNQNTDCWSLGITLYEMLTGMKPFSYSYREHEMIVKMENQSFLNNSKFKILSKNSQEFLKLLLDPDNTNRISPQEGLKHQFITRTQNDNYILNAQDLNIPLQANSQNTPTKKSGGLTEVTPKSCNNNNSKYSFQQNNKQLNVHKNNNTSLNNNNNNNNINMNNESIQKNYFQM